MKKLLLNIPADVIAGLAQTHRCLRPRPRSRAACVRPLHTDRQDGQGESVYS